MKVLEEMYENKLEFHWGRGGGQNEKPPLGGVWIFSGTARYPVYFVAFFCGKIN